MEHQIRTLHIFCSVTCCWTPKGEDLFRSCYSDVSRVINTNPKNSSPARSRLNPESHFSLNQVLGCCPISSLEYFKLSRSMHLRNHKGTRNSLSLRACVSKKPILDQKGNLTSVSLRNILSSSKSHVILPYLQFGYIAKNYYMPSKDHSFSLSSRKKVDLLQEFFFVSAANTSLGDLPKAKSTRGSR